MKRTSRNTASEARATGTETCDTARVATEDDPKELRLTVAAYQRIQSLRPDYAIAGAASYGRQERVRSFLTLLVLRPPVSHDYHEFTVVREATWRRTTSNVRPETATPETNSTQVA